MVCPKCNSENVVIQTSTYVESQSRSFLWNLFMVVITGGLWILWILIRKRKEKVVNKTIATCQNCGNSWEVE